MTLRERNQKIKKYQLEQMSILDKKGMDYTGGEESTDGNRNFSEIAGRLEGAPLTDLTVCMIYLEKQIMALETFIKTGHLESEGIESRLNDVSNYANIFRTLLEETK